MNPKLWKILAKLSNCPKEYPFPDYDYTGKPLSTGPAQEVRDLEPKLTPREPSLEAKKKHKERIEEYRRTLK